ncbi:hypothetical protein COE03_11495 [Bacillus thuringiensis]|nr:hypothetical protein COE03_11495 [Bacillus thuringiensis]
MFPLKQVFFVHMDHTPFKVVLPVWLSWKNTFQVFGDFCIRIENAATKLPVLSFFICIELFILCLFTHPFFDMQKYYFCVILAIENLIKRRSK